MLTKLSIQNYALVDKIDINLKPGLTVLTGETGAGKSVIIGGLALTLGGRADKELIRHGSKKTVVESTFENLSPSLTTRINTNLKNPKGNSLFFKREISVSGASRGYLNNQQENIGSIRDAAELVCGLHSQQGQRNLLESDRHHLFLDSYAGITKKVEKLAELFTQFNSFQRQLAEAQRNANSMREKLDLINFQIDELTKAEIRVGEENDLVGEKKRLESVQSLMEIGRSAVDSISENDNSVISILSQLESKMGQAVDIDSRLKENAELLSESVINLNELTGDLESYLSRLSDNPERLEEINSRLSELYRLRKKYNADEAGLEGKLELLQMESSDSGDIESYINKLKQNLKDSRLEYYKLASEISRKRIGAGLRFEKKIVKQLSDLAISKARFKIDFQIESDENGFESNGEKLKPNPFGFETTEFLISTNPNEPLRPLAKIASGGEISRIMLALLTVIAGKYRLPTIVFDEIDTGIGGRTAIKLADKLKELSKNHQIITISHLSAVASKADHHIAVSKTRIKDRNNISAKELSGDSITEELSRMTGGV